MLKISNFLVGISFVLVAFGASAQSGVYYNSQGQIYQPFPNDSISNYGNQPSPQPYYPQPSYSQPGYYQPQQPTYVQSAPPIYVQPPPVVYAPPQPNYYSPPSYGLDGTSLLIGGITGALIYNAFKPRHNYYSPPSGPGFRPPSNGGYRPYRR